MGLREWADRLAGAEGRALTYQSVWGSGGSWSESTKQVSVEAALGLPALYGAVDIIAGQIAALPLKTYRKLSDSRREPAPDGPLVTNPSNIWAPDEWLYVAAASMLLYGEAIGVATRMGTNGWPQTIEWVDPRRVEVERADGALRYTLDGDLLPTSTVTHIRHGILLPGTVRGVPPIRRMNNSLSVGLEALIYERDWFAGGGHPSGVLSVDVPALTEDQADEIISRFVAKTRARRPVALARIASYQSIQADPSTSNLDQTKRRIANDIASIYHVTPEMIGGNLGESMTYANLETQQATLDVRALMPVYTRLERALSRLTPRPTYIRFNVDAQARVDLKTRAEVAEIQLRSGQRTIDEVRAKDDLVPIAEAPGYVPPPQAQVP